MTNVLYDFTPAGQYTAVGVGIGAVKFRRRTAAAHRAVHQRQYLAIRISGYRRHRYNLNPTLTLDLDYRYLATTQPTFRITNTNLR